jgi:hypothetical protein
VGVVVVDRGWRCTARLVLEPAVHAHETLLRVGGSDPLVTPLSRMEVDGSGACARVMSSGHTGRLSRALACSTAPCGESQREQTSENETPRTRSHPI